MNNNAIEQFISAVKEPEYETNTTYSAVVSRVDSEGVVWVNLAGSEKETPTASTAADVKAGDVVTVQWRNNKLYIAGNYSDPSAGVIRVANVEAAANTAREAANNAVSDAGRARTAAEQAEATAAGVEGIAVQARQAAQDTQNSLKSVVQGATTVEKAVSVMQTALESIAEYDPNAITETFTGDGSETDFTLQTKATNILSVTVDGESAEYTTAVVGGVTVVTITPAPSNDASISVSYDTTKEWFWHDANGAHVLGDTNGYRNDITSSGMKVMDVTDEVSVAEFGASGAQIGKNGGSHLELDYHSLQMIDGNTNTFFHVSDLRDENNEYEYTEEFTGTGYTTRFSLSFRAKREKELSVTVSDGSGGEAYLDPSNAYWLRFETAPTIGATITVSYITDSYLAKAYTLGMRKKNSGIGPLSTCFGSDNIASGSRSLAEGWYTEATGACSHSEGYESKAYGLEAHAEGENTTASGNYSHAEGDNSIASGARSHAEGSSTASGEYAHSEGDETVASGSRSHAQNSNTIAGYNSQTVIGKYNDNQSYTAFEIGNGASSARSNALTVDWNGNVDASGDVTDGSGNILSNKANKSSLPQIRKGYISLGKVNANSYKDVTVTFSSAMSETPIVVCSMFSTSTSPTMGGIAVSAINASTSGFTCRAFNNTSSARTPAIEYIAIY